MSRDESECYHIAARVSTVVIRRRKRLFLTEDVYRATRVSTSQCRNGLHQTGRIREKLLPAHTPDNKTYLVQDHRTVTLTPSTATTHILWSGGVVLLPVFPLVLWSSPNISIHLEWYVSVT